MPLSRRYTPEWAPGEKANLGLDFSYVVPRGVGIASGSLAAFTNAATPAASSDFQIGPVTVRGRAIYATVSGGVAGRDYQMRWSATDTQGNVWPRVALMLCSLTS